MQIENQDFLLSIVSNVKKTKNTDIIINMLKQQSAQQNISNPLSQNYPHLSIFAIQRNWLLEITQNLDILNESVDIFYTTINQLIQFYNREFQSIVIKDKQLVDILINVYQKIIIQEKNINAAQQIMEIIIFVIKVQIINQITIENNQAKMITDFLLQQFIFKRNFNQQCEEKLFELLLQGYEFMFKNVLEQFIQDYTNSYFLNQQHNKLFIKLILSLQEKLAFIQQEQILQIILQGCLTEKNNQTINNSLKFIQVFFTNQTLNVPKTKEIIETLHKLNYYLQENNFNEQVILQFFETYSLVIVNSYLVNKEEFQGEIIYLYSTLFDIYSQQNKINQGSNTKSIKDKTLIIIKDIINKTINFQFLQKVLFKNQEDINELNSLLSQLSFSEGSSLATMFQQINLKSNSDNKKFNQNELMLSSKFFVMLGYLLQDEYRNSFNYISGILESIFDKMIANYEDFSSIQFFLTNIFNKVQQIRNVQEDKYIIKLSIKVLEIMNLKDFLQNQMQIKDQSFVQKYSSFLNQINNSVQEVNIQQETQKFMHELVPVDKESPLQNQLFLNIMEIIQNQNCSLQFRTLFELFSPIYYEIVFKTNQALIQQAPEADNLYRIFISLSKFSKINSQNSNDITLYLNFLLDILLQEDLKILNIKKGLINQITQILVFIINNQNLHLIFNQAKQVIQNKSAFGQCCVQYLQSENTQEKDVLLNIIKLLVFFLDQQRLPEIVERNIDKFYQILQEKNNKEITKIIYEIRLIQSLISQLQELHTNQNLLQKSIQLIYLMLQQKQQKVITQALKFTNCILIKLPIETHQGLLQSIYTYILDQIQSNSDTNYSLLLVTFLYKYLTKFNTQIFNNANIFNIVVDQYFSLIITGYQDVSWKMQFWLEEIFSMLFQQQQEKNLPITKNNKVVVIILASLNTQENLQLKSILFALRRLVQKYYYQMDKELQSIILEVAVLFLQNENSNIIFSSLKLLQKLIKFMDDLNLDNNLQNFLYLLNQLQPQYISKFRNQLKLFLLKLNKKISKEKILQDLNEDLQKLFKSALKQEINEQNKKKKKDKEFSQEKYENKQGISIDKKTGKIHIEQNVNQTQKESGYQRDFSTLQNQHSKIDMQKVESNVYSNLPGQSLGYKVLKRLKQQQQDKSEFIHFVQESGQQFQGKNKDSDIQTQSNISPHAFVQLNSQALSKKLREKASQTFQLLMKKKTKGGLRGLVIVNNNKK